MSVRSYSDLMNFGSFEERFRYLILDGVIGIDTFGFDRYMNQNFYKSSEWRNTRSKIILRDNGCDLGIVDRPIFDKVIIHHMNPIMVKDIVEVSDYLMNPEFLICTSLSTHNAIHYGDLNYLEQNKIVERTLNDTKPWRK